MNVWVAPLPLPGAIESAVGVWLTAGVTVNVPVDCKPVVERLSVADMYIVFSPM